MKKTFDESEYFNKNDCDRRYRFEHSCRVAAICRQIAEAEGMDAEALSVAGMLHDIAYRDYFPTKEIMFAHGRASAEIARPFLKTLFDDKTVNDICFGIAIHVDDKSDFEGERTPFTLSVGDADNIDRFDAYRIFDTLRMFEFHEMPLDEKIDFVNKSIAKRKQYTEMQLATAEATALWRENVAFQLDFYEKLLAQLMLTYTV